MSLLYSKKINPSEMSENTENTEHIPYPPLPGNTAPEDSNFSPTYLSNISPKDLVHSRVISNNWHGYPIPPPLNFKTLSFFSKSVKIIKYDQIIFNYYILFDLFVLLRNIFFLILILLSCLYLSGAFSVLYMNIFIITKAVQWGPHIQFSNPSLPSFAEGNSFLIDLSQDS